MFHKIKRILGIVLIVAFLLILVYILFVRISGNTPSFFGFSFLRISSASMEPELNVGEIVLVQKTDPSALKLGDVVTYRGEKGSLAGKLITHQISKEPYQVDGVYYFTTRGIQPNLVDDPEFDETKLVGKVAYKIPFLGTVFDFFSEWYGLVAFIAIILIIFSSEIFNLVQELRYAKDDKPIIEGKEVAPEKSSDFTEQRELEIDGLLTDLDDEVE